METRVSNLLSAKSNRILPSWGAKCSSVLNLAAILILKIRLSSLLLSTTSTSLNNPSILYLTTISPSLGSICISDDLLSRAFSTTLSRSSLTFLDLKSRPSTRVLIFKFSPVPVSSLSKSTFSTPVSSSGVVSFGFSTSPSSFGSSECDIFYSSR
jgi:hypothetical protein